MTDHGELGNPVLTPRPGGTADLAGHALARVGYGAMQLERRRDDPAAAVNVVRRAIDLGVDLIDTAQYYGNGFANDVIRRALRADDHVTVVTKIGSDPVDDADMPMRAAQRPEELRATVETNLRALGLDQLPVVNLRRMDVGPSVPLDPDQVVDLDDQLAAMTAMRDEGLIGAIGLSSIAMDSLRRALPVGVACVSNAYSLVDRSDEPLLELCRQHDIAWIPYFPLGSAFPGMPKVTDQAAVQSVAAQLGITPSQVGLAWLLQHASNTLLIPGTSSVEHLEANLAVGDIRLSQAMVEELDDVRSDASA